MNRVRNGQRGYKTNSEKSAIPQPALVSVLREEVRAHLHAHLSPRAMLRTFADCVSRTFQPIERMLRYNEILRKGSATRDEVAYVRNVSLRTVDLMARCGTIRRLDSPSHSGSVRFDITHLRNLENYSESLFDPAAWAATRSCKEKGPAHEMLRRR